MESVLSWRSDTLFYLRVHCMYKVTWIVTVL